MAIEPITSSRGKEKAFRASSPTVDEVNDILYNSGSEKSDRTFRQSYSDSDNIYILCVCEISDNEVVRCPTKRFPTKIYCFHK